MGAGLRRRRAGRRVPRRPAHAVGAQRAPRDLRHALVQHRPLRPAPWPWILTGLACLLIFPGAADGERAYIRCLNFVPNGLKGLVLAGFFSALMAIDTRLNIGAAYFVNDFYRPYLVKDRDESTTSTSRASITVVQMLLALLMFPLVTEVKSVFFLTLAIGSGTGLVFLLRWYWWRINAWSEIAAMAAGLVNLLVFRFVDLPERSRLQRARPAGAALRDRRRDDRLGRRHAAHAADRCRHARAFYRKVRPAGPGWAAIARRGREQDPATRTRLQPLRRTS